MMNNEHWRKIISAMREIVGMSIKYECEHLIRIADHIVIYKDIDRAYRDACAEIPIKNDCSKRYLSALKTIRQEGEQLFWQWSRQDVRNVVLTDTKYPVIEQATTLEERRMNDVKACPYFWQYLGIMSNRGIDPRGYEIVRRSWECSRRNAFIKEDVMIHTGFDSMKEAYYKYDNAYIPYLLSADRFGGVFDV